MRLLSMLLMLAVLYMLLVWARDPNTWRWFADDSGAEEGRQTLVQTDPEPKAAAKDQTPEPLPAAEPTPKGPTDEDPDEQDGVREEFQAITDKTLQILPEEMFAYKRVLQWVVNQPISAMEKRARTDLSFRHLMTSPDKHRGALVKLELNVGLVQSIDDFSASDGSDLYEVWGHHKDSGSWLYGGIVVNLPKGMPVGSRVNERVRFVGYFFKLQGYHEANARPHAPPLVAPMLIGRLTWIQAPAPARAKWDASWTALAVVGFALVVGLHLLWLFLRPKRRSSSMKPIGKPKPGALTIDEWFENAEKGTAALGDETPGDPPPDPTVQPGRNGKGAAGDKPFSHPLDGGVADGG
jgi:hypothetical protein